MFKQSREVSFGLEQNFKGTQTVPEYMAGTLHIAEKIGQDRKFRSPHAAEEQGGSARAAGAALNGSKLKMRIDLHARNTLEPPGPLQIQNTVHKIAISHAPFSRPCSVRFQCGVASYWRIAARMATAKKRFPNPRISFFFSLKRARLWAMFLARCKICASDSLSVVRALGINAVSSGLGILSQGGIGNAI
jgi:hypothetical protein